MQALKDKLGISKNVQKFTGTVEKETQFTKFEDQMPQHKGWNYMGDTLYLPTTREGFKFLLVVCDLADKSFDIEPMKAVTDTDSLNAYKLMLKRRFIKIPEYKMSTDAGNEFKGEFDAFLKKHNIFHKVARAGRHKQQSPVESLIKTISSLLIGYMNEKELETGKKYREWTDKIHVVRTDLNKLRKKVLHPKTHIYKTFNNLNEKGIVIKPKFNVGDMVHVKNEKAKDSFGHNQSTSNFRTGDYRWEQKTREVKEVLNYVGDIPYRYMVDGIENASFTDKELKKG